MSVDSVLDELGLLGKNRGNTAYLGNPPVPIVSKDIFTFLGLKEATYNNQKSSWNKLQKFVDKFKEVRRKGEETKQDVEHYKFIKEFLKAVRSSKEPDYSRRISKLSVHVVSQMTNALGKQNIVYVSLFHLWEMSDDLHL